MEATTAAKAGMNGPIRAILRCITSSASADILPELYLCFGESLPELEPPAAEN
jgi:hypothetical protein